MRRDFGNEIVVAIAAVAIVAFALAFAILLAISSGVGTSPQNVADSNVELETPTETLEIDNPPPSETLEEPLATPTATQTQTTVLTSTNTNTPTRTPTAEEASTATPRGRLATPTPTATMTIAPTNTALVKIASPTVQPATDQPTATFTPSPSPSSTFTATPTATWTVSPTASATASPTLTLTATVTPTLEPCTRPRGWVDYVVQSGDTLYAIAQAVQYPMADIRDVNCLQAADGLISGQVVFVPTRPIRAVATLAPAVLSPQRRVAAEGCVSGRVQIVVPLSLQQLKGIITVVGTANDEQMVNYQLSIRPDAIATYELYHVGTDVVQNGVLGALNTELFDNGLHWIRLALYDGQEREIAACVVPVFFTD